MQVNIGRLAGGFCVYWDENGKRRRFKLKAGTLKEAQAEGVERFRRETYKAQPKGCNVAEIWAAYRADLGDRATGVTMGYTGKAIMPKFGAYLTDHVIEYGLRPVGSIRKGFANAVARTDIGKLRIHDLRHTAAVTMLSEGIPIEKVAQMLGHSNISVTYRIYGRYMPEHMQDAADVLDFSAIKSAG